MENLIVEVEPFVWVQQFEGRMLDSPGSEMDKELQKHGYCIKKETFDLPGKSLQVTMLYSGEIFGGHFREHRPFYPKECVFYFGQTKPFKLNYYCTYNERRDFLETILENLTNRVVCASKGFPNYEKFYYRVEEYYSPWGIYVKCSEAEARCYKKRSNYDAVLNKSETPEQFAKRWRHEDARICATNIKKYKLNEEFSYKVIGKRDPALLLQSLRRNGEGSGFYRCYKVRNILDTIKAIAEEGDYERDLFAMIVTYLELVTTEAKAQGVRVSHSRCKKIIKDGQRNAEVAYSLILALIIEIESKILINKNHGNKRKSRRAAIKPQGAVSLPNGCLNSTTLGRNCP